MRTYCHGLLRALTLSLALPLTTVATAQQGGELPAPADEKEAYRQQLSYCMGLDMGQSLASDKIDVNLQALVAGLQDALAGNQPKLSKEQISAVMSRFRQEMQQKAENRMSQIAADNLARGEAFLTENRSKEGVQETPSGLQYRVVEAGDGASPTVSDTVRCHYEGTLIDGTVFDSSYKRGEPAEFPVAAVIAGWTEALQMMKVGGKWEVFLPANIAYGERGAGGSIGPNETLLFTIELLDIVN